MQDLTMDNFGIAMDFLLMLDLYKFYVEIRDPHPNPTPSTR